MGNVAGSMNGSGGLEAVIREAGDRFFGAGAYTVASSTGGMNNTTRKISFGGRDYILRLYDTHQEMIKAEFEHAVLAALCGMELGYRVPEPVAARTGETVIRLERGKLAAAFRFIEGSAPDLRIPAQAEGFGAAAGRLAKGLAAVEAELGEGLRPAYPPYYELGDANAAYPLSEAVRFCAAPPGEFRGMADSLMLLADEIGRIRPGLQHVRSLPHQLIHGDLNASNALVHRDGTVAALLDFEFATRDLRAMEPAVCLWGLVPEGGGEGLDSGEEAAWASIAAFWKGYSGVCPLTERERAAIPELMQLRSLDVFLHFLGRYQEGVDGGRVLAGIIPETAARVRWVADNRLKLAQLLQSC